MVAVANAQGRQSARVDELVADGPWGVIAAQLPNDDPIKQGGSNAERLWQLRGCGRRQGVALPGLL